MGIIFLVMCMRYIAKNRLFPDIQFFTNRIGEHFGKKETYERINMRGDCIGIRILFKP